MAQIAGILDHRLDFDPSADIESFLRQVPGKWVVYLFTDPDDRPLQLLCVKNLRASLKRRLLGQEQLALSKRVDYREIVRQIHWRRVDSAFEADWVYHDVAQRIFPDTYQGMVGFSPAWFVHVNPDAKFPRYVKAIDLSAKPGVYLGPIADKHAAARFIELVEDAFDLCRYYNILIEAPAGRACAYKEMGKCPAPCDGSISTEQYRGMIQWSASVAANPEEFIREQTERMRQAAAELRFETAAKIKSFIDQLSQFGKGPFRHLRRLEDFAFVSLQQGPTAGTAKVILILPGYIEEIADLIAMPDHPGDLLRTILAAAASRSVSALDAQDVERVGIVAHHLFFPDKSPGLFIPLADLSEKAVIVGYKQLVRRKRPDEVEDEGIVKELQAM